jgi:hypothetical protein
MVPHLALALAGVTLIGSPDSGSTTPPNETPPVTRAETLAASAGQVLGAASACDKIAKGRLDTAAQSVGEAVQGEVDDDDELTSAHDMFVEGVAAGRRSIASGDVDCEAAAARLADLERSVRR